MPRSGRKSLSGSGSGRQSTPGASEPPLSFTALDLQAETAALNNNSNHSISLKGFFLRDVNGKHCSAPFEDGVEVPAGKQATVYTCPGKRGTPAPSEDALHIHWRNKNGTPRKHTVLNNDGDGLELVNAEGAVVCSIYVDDGGKMTTDTNAAALAAAAADEGKAAGQKEAASVVSLRRATRSATQETSDTESSHRAGLSPRRRTQGTGENIAASPARNTRASASRSPRMPSPARNTKTSASRSPRALQTRSKVSSKDSRSNSIAADESDSAGSASDSEDEQDTSMIKVRSADFLDADDDEGDEGDSHDDDNGEVLHVEGTARVGEEDDDDEEEDEDSGEEREDDDDIAPQQKARAASGSADHASDLSRVMERIKLAASRPALLTDPEKLTLSSSLECRLDSEPRYLDVRLPKPEKGKLSKGKPAALNPDAERRRVDAMSRGAAVGPELEKAAGAPAFKVSRTVRRGVADAERKRNPTLGPKWFDMPATPLTEDLKMDLKLLKMRNVLNPKRHYKTPDSKTLPKYFHVGTLEDSATDYYSKNRSTKKSKRMRLIEELMKDVEKRKYNKRKYLELTKSKYGPKRRTSGAAGGPPRGKRVKRAGRS